MHDNAQLPSPVTSTGSAQASAPGVTVAQVLAAALHRAGVKRIYGLPGGGSSLDLIEAAGQLGIDFVLTKSENAAVMMAGAMAESTGIPGVALMTKGPGVANAANGVAYASLDRAPLIVISDGFTSKQLAYVTHQVFEQRAMLAPVVKGHGRLEGPDAVAEIDQLIALACTAPYGPVHIELTGEAARRVVIAQNRSESTVGAPDRLALRALAARLEQARHPVLVLGLEARYCASEIRQLQAHMQCPVLVTYKAKGVLPDADPWVVGLFTGGSQEEECLAQSDLMVLVGVDPVEMIIQPWRYGKPVVTLSAAHHPVHYVVPEISLVGNFAGLVGGLRLALQARSWAWSPDQVRQLKSSMLERLAYPPVASGVAPDRVVSLAAQLCERRQLRPRMSVDAGAHMFSATAFFPCSHSGDCLISNGLATMSFALPAAIAAALDDPSHPVFCFTGDGGLMMCLGELCTAVERAANIIIIVFNDSALSLIDIKQQSRALPSQGVRWSRHDFASTMQALGGTGMQAHDEASYLKALERALDGQGPRLIDVEIDPVGYPQQLKAMRG